MKEISEARAIAESSNAVKILKGIVISAVITLVLLFFYAIILTYTSLGENTIGPVVIGITGISILARKLDDNKFYKEEWNTKWRDNWASVYSIYIFSIKHFTEADLH